MYVSPSVSKRLGLELSAVLSFSRVAASTLSLIPSPSVSTTSELVPVSELSTYVPEPDSTVSSRPSSSSSVSTESTTPSPSVSMSTTRGFEPLSTSVPSIIVSPSESSFKGSVPVLLLST